MNKQQEHEIIMGWTFSLDLGCECFSFMKRTTCNKQLVAHIHSLPIATKHIVSVIHFHHRSLSSNYYFLSIELKSGCPLLRQKYIQTFCLRGKISFLLTTAAQQIGPTLSAKEWIRHTSILLCFFSDKECIFFPLLF